MRVLSSLLRRRGHEVWPFLRTAAVLYCEHGILIAATHRTTDGMTPWGEPVASLPLDADATKTGDAILAALHASRDGLSVDEGARQHQAVLRASGEPSWSKLEHHWECLGVAMDGDGASATIRPTHRYQTGGWVNVAGDPEYAVALVPDAIGAKVLEIVTGLPLPVEHRAR